MGYGGSSFDRGANGKDGRMSMTKKQDSDRAIALNAKRYLGQAQTKAANILEHELDGIGHTKAEKRELIGRMKGLRDAIFAGARDADWDLLGL